MTTGEPLTWADGRPVGLAADEWAARVSTFLGCGFRVRVDPHPRSLTYAREAAGRVATRLAAALDETPWEELTATETAQEVVGGWEYGFRGGWGRAWTRVTPVPPLSARLRRARGVRLPWTFGSTTPTAGLPMIATLEATLAERHLAEQGAGVGWWVDHRDELCTSTAGPLLVRLDGAWVAPSATGHWLHAEVARALEAAAVVVPLARLADADGVCAVGDDGIVTAVTADEAHAWPLAEESAGAVLTAVETLTSP